MGLDRNILVAEPADSLLRRLGSFSEQKGFTAVKADSLKETLLTLQGQRIDVLVLDAALLEKDYGFISVIKGMEEDLPIIICAETNTPELEGTIRKQRIFYYHIKSFGIEDLEMAISNAVNRLP